MRDFTPRPWQFPMIEFGLANPRCCIFGRMGLGKTSAVLAIVDTLLKSRGAKKALIIGPLRVARSTWPEEATKWEQFAHLKVQPITGTLDERKAALRNGKADIYTLNYENLPWLVDQIGPEHWPFDLVVADESARLRSFRLQQGGKRAQALAKVAHSKVRRWINLSGMPTPNGLVNLWGQMYFVDKGARLGRTFDDFQTRWFGYQRAQQALHAHKTYVQRVVFPHAQIEITDKIKDVALAFSPKDWFSVKVPIVERVYVDLPPEARARYREMEKALFTTIGGYDIEVFAKSAAMIKTMQLANGAAYSGADEAITGDTAHWVEAHDEKLQALESIIEEAAGEPVLVAYHFKPDLARLKKRFPDGRHITTKRDEEDFKAGLIDVAFVHPQSIGHGIDGFQNVCHIIVFFAISFDLETHDQLVERVGPMRQAQAGLDREVMVYLILARGTVDETMADRLVLKRGVQEATMDTLAFKQEQLW